MAPKADAHYVFVEFSNSSGWSNDGVSWLVGLLSTVYPFLGYDAASHIAEEVKNPARDVPIAMVGSVVVNGVMGLLYTLILLFSLTNLDTLLETPTGFPFMQLFLNVTKSPAGATIMSLTVCLIATAANSAGLTSTSRTAWAFARDGALPYSQYFEHIDPKSNTPVRMIFCTTIIQMLLGFLYLGSSTAFNAVLSMAILGLYASYAIPIVYMILRRRNLPASDFGPFKLGKTGGMIINVVSVAWLGFSMVFSTFPTVMPVTPQNMNYSVVVMAGWLIFGACYYVLRGHKSYSGPIIEVLGQESPVA
jgi:choline transport protein